MSYNDLIAQYNDCYKHSWKLIIIIYTNNHYNTSVYKAV